MAGDLDHRFVIAEAACLCNHAHALIVVADCFAGDNAGLKVSENPQRLNTCVATY
jgi:hypothetical protein